MEGSLACLCHSSCRQIARGIISAKRRCGWICCSLFPRRLLFFFCWPIGAGVTETRTPQPGDGEVRPPPRYRTLHARARPQDQPGGQTSEIYVCRPWLFGNTKFLLFIAGFNVLHLNTEFQVLVGATRNFIAATKAQQKPCPSRLETKLRKLKNSETPLRPQTPTDWLAPLSRRRSTCQHSYLTPLGLSLLFFR